MSVASLDPLLVDRLARMALEEDLGRAGDITSAATIPAAATAAGMIAAREDGVVAGIALAQATFRLLEPAVTFEARIADGTEVQPGSAIADVHGSARALLGAERVALNFLGRLSGIATATAAYARRIAHTKAHVCCTRKTTPGLRAVEKYAVRCGGGRNHRFGLDDAVLIKDNHIVVAGSIRAALRAAKAAIGHLVKIEIEVDTLDQLREVIEEGADVVLLDNMTTDQLREAVALVGGRMVTEASGTVRLDTVAAIAATGVDLISVGALTHSARVLDLGLDLKIAR